MPASGENIIPSTALNMRSRFKYQLRHRETDGIADGGLAARMYRLKQRAAFIVAHAGRWAFSHPVAFVNTT